MSLAPRGHPADVDVIVAGGGGVINAASDAEPEPAPLVSEEFNLDQAAAMCHLLPPLPGVNICEANAMIIIISIFKNQFLNFFLFKKLCSFSLSP